MRLNKWLLSTMLLGVVFLDGCATSQKVQVSQIGDTALTCQQIADQFAELDKAQADVDSKKGVTGTNVASALFFLPGLVYTFYDAGEATNKISERRTHLSDIFMQKKCDPALLKAGTVTSTQSSGS